MTFLDQIHELTPFENSQFLQLLNLLLLYPRKTCFRSRISSKAFSWPILPKKQLSKMAIFEPKPLVTFLEKSQFFDFFNFLSLKPRKAFFRSRLSSKTFFWPVLRKKNGGKMDIFGLKQWVNPFGKMSMFRLFELLFFIA